MYSDIVPLCFVHTNSLYCPNKARGLRRLTSFSFGEMFFAAPGDLNKT